MLNQGEDPCYAGLPVGPKVHCGVPHAPGVFHTLRALVSVLTTPFTSRTLHSLSFPPFYARMIEKKKYSFNQGNTCPVAHWTERVDKKAKKTKLWFPVRPFLLYAQQVQACRGGWNRRVQWVGRADVGSLSWCWRGWYWVRPVGPQPRESSVSLTVHLLMGAHRDQSDGSVSPPPVFAGCIPQQTYRHEEWAHVGTHLPRHTHVQPHTFLHSNIHTHTHSHKHTQADTHRHPHTRAHTHTGIDTYIKPHTHSHTSVLSGKEN